jgi:hypothetical protein
MSLSNSLSMYVQVLAQNHPPADIFGLREEESSVTALATTKPTAYSGRLGRLRLPRDEGFLPTLDPPVGKHLLLSEMYGRRLLGLVGDNLLEFLRGDWVSG